MFRKIILTSLAFGCCLVFVRCVQNPYNFKAMGLKPVYESFTDAAIAVLPPKANINPGKILQSGTLTYQVDKGFGVHVINCADVANPVKIAFIKVTGISEIHLKNNVLLVDQMQDLVSLQLNSNGTVTELDRLAGIIKLPDYEAPNVANTYFECPDASKGHVVGWVEAELINPKCKTSN